MPSKFIPIINTILGTKNQSLPPIPPYHMQHNAIDWIYIIPQQTSENCHLFKFTICDPVLDVL